MSSQAGPAAGLQVCGSDDIGLCYLYFDRNKLRRNICKSEVKLSVRNYREIKTVWKIVAGKVSHIVLAIIKETLACQHFIVGYIFSFYCEPILQPGGPAALN